MGGRGKGAEKFSEARVKKKPATEPGKERGNVGESTEASRTEILVEGHAQL